MRSPTPDLAFVVRSLRNAAHLPVAAMTADAATTWGVGEYALIAERLEPAANAVVDLAGVNDSDRVLDVATGTGNAALRAASRGANVVGLDFEPRLLDIARAALTAPTSTSIGSKQTSNRHRSNERHSRSSCQRSE